MRLSVECNTDTYAALEVGPWSERTRSLGREDSTPRSTMPGDPDISFLTRDDRPSAPGAAVASLSASCLM